MTDRVLVAGVDSSTQSTKVVVCDAEHRRDRPRAGAPRTPTAPRSTRPPGGPRYAGGDAAAGCSTASAPSPSPGSSTGWSLSTRTAPSCETRCCGTTPVPPAPRPTSCRARRPAGLGRRRRHRAGGQHHRDEAALAGRARARARRPDAGGGAPARLADGADPRRLHGRRAARHRPRRRLRHRLLGAVERRRTGPTCSSSGVRPRARAAARAGTARGGGDHGEPGWSSAPALATTWAPHWVSASGPATSSSRSAPAGRSFGVARRTDRRPDRVRRRVRRRDRPLPAAGVHPQRGPGPDAAATMLGTDHAGLDGWPSRRSPGQVGSPCCPTSTASGPPTCPTRPAPSAGSPGRTSRRRTSRGLPSRACCAVWPTGSTRCATTASPSIECCSSAVRARSTAVQAVASWDLRGAGVGAVTGGVRRPRGRSTGRVGARAQPWSRRRGAPGLGDRRAGGARPGR